MNGEIWPVLASVVPKATVLLAVVIGACACLRRSSAALRRLVLALAQIGLLILPLLVSCLPSWHLEVLPVRQETTGTSGASGRLPASPGRRAHDGSTKRGRTETGARWGDSTRAARSAGAPPAAGVATRDARPRLEGFLTVVWVLVAGLLLARLVAGLLGMSRQVRQADRLNDSALLRQLDQYRRQLGLRARPALVASDRVAVPVTWGWLRPAVVVPRSFPSWTDGQQRAALLHELVHLRRVDWPVLIVDRLAVSLYWFHPLVWFLARRARDERERACDDLVVRCGMKASDYAAQLLSIHGILKRTSAMPPREALAFVRRSQLVHRVRSILDPRLPRREPSRRTALAAVVLLATFVLPLASLRLTPQALADDRGTGEVRVDSQDGESWFDEATSLHERGRFEQAAAAFERAADLGYSPETALYDAACGHAQLGDVAKALELLERSWEVGLRDLDLLIEDTDLDPLRPDERFQAFVDRAFEMSGTIRQPQKHYPRRAALEKVAALRDEGSTDGEAWEAVGTRLLFLRELDLAREALSEAVDHLGPRGATAMYNLACVLSLAGDEEEALDWLDRALEAGFDAHQRLIDDSDLEPLRRGDRFAALAAKSEILDLGRFRQDPGDRSRYSKEQWEPAVEIFREYVTKHAESGRAWFNLGWSLHYSSRFDEAIPAFEKAFALGYLPATAAYNVACGHAMRGRADAALQWLRTAIERGFDDPDGLEGDRDLDRLRTDFRFAELLDRLKKRVG